MVENIQCFDPTEAVQHYLRSKCSKDVKVIEKCVLAVDAYEIIHWKKIFRIISLVRKRTSYAVIIFTGIKFANNSYHNLKAVEAMPFNVNLKLKSDDSTYSEGDLLAAILVGEDFTLADFDPLRNPVVDSDFNDGELGTTTTFSSKQISLQFKRDDFLKFSQQLSNLTDYCLQQTEETFNSFEWLHKIKDLSDEHASDDCINNMISEVDNIDGGSGKIHSASSSPKTTNFIEFQNISISSILADNVFQPNSQLISKNTSTVHSNKVNNAWSQQSMGDLHEPLRRPDVMQRNREIRNQSSPDLLDESKTRYSYFPINEQLHNVYIEQKLQERMDDYCNWEDHTLFIGTWNVNGRIDELSNLDDWLCPPKGIKYPQIYVLGFQELDLSIGGVVMNSSTSNSLEERWIKYIENSTPFTRKQYKRLHRVRLAGILLLVFIQKSLEKFVPDNCVTFSKVPTGIFNVMGNKGGVAISFRAFNSNLCFVNCHLAAGENNRFRRDQDFKEIERSLAFYVNDEALSIYEHDLVFLMGDLNYRLLNIDASMAKRLAAEANIDALVERDELITQSKSVFHGFHEGKIEFLPTYKFLPNSDRYDDGEKNRIPSFCDRIMWKGKHCRQLKYSSHMSLKISDHKPVSSWFKIGLKKVDFAKRMKVQESIIRSIDLIYNLNLPQAKIDKQEIFFEQVHFYEHRQASINVTNTGQNEFRFRFKEIPGSPRIPDWLTVQPSESTIKPGCACELIFEIFINANNVTDLNTRKEVQCILVLDLQGGKDYFITVTADLVPTSFGLPLSLLVNLTEPVATLSRAELFEKTKPFIQRVSIVTQNQDSNTFTTPKEVMVMFDYMLKNITEEEIFSRPGCHSEIQHIREQLDTKGKNADFNGVSVHSVVEAFLMFLSSLYFPIIPNELMMECMGVYNNFMESVKVIARLPNDHRNLFHYLTSFLRKVLEKRSQNGTDAGSLGLIFVDLIFRPKNLEANGRDMCAFFIKQFLTNDPAKYFRTPAKE